MSNSVELIDNMDDVFKALDMGAEEFLTTAGLETVNQAKMNTRVDTGQTRDGWTYELESESVVAVGNIEENAIWEEFGTGIYAEDENGAPSGKGRQDGWVYVDSSGQGHYTRGKTATHALTKAIDKAKVEFEEMAKKKIGGNMK